MKNTKSTFFLLSIKQSFGVAAITIFSSATVSEIATIFSLTQGETKPCEVSSAKQVPDQAKGSRTCYYGNNVDVVEVHQTK